MFPRLYDLFCFFESLSDSTLLMRYSIILYQDYLKERNTLKRSTNFLKKYVIEVN